MTSPEIDFKAPELLAAYQKVDVDLRVKALKICCVLAIALKLSAIGLDHLVYPELQWQIFAVRIFAALMMGLILLVRNSGLMKRHVHIFGVLWAMIVQLAVCFMIYLTADPASPYYAGLNLVILAVGVLLPWTFSESILVCSLTLVCYVVIALLGAGGPVAWNLFLGNISFMLFTDAIAITSSYFRSRQRFQEFCLQHQLSTHVKELSELDRQKSELFANISHEFRTPLTLIIAPLDELLKDPSAYPKEATDRLLIVRDNSLRLLKLVNDLLELVRLEHSRSPVHMESVETGNFLAGMAAAVRHLAEKKGLQLTVERPEVPLSIKADVRCLEKAIMNLLINAIKFTPSGGQIRTRCFRREESVVIDIQDTGIGIAAQDLPFIFRRFRQVDGSATRSAQGLGIGLALARELVEEQNGKLFVQSELGKGSVFTLEMPYAEARHNAENSPSQVPEPVLDIYRRANQAFTIAEEHVDAPADGNAASSATVLIVEDEDGMRRFLGSVLSRDVAVVELAHGLRAVETIRESRPDLVLLDVMLPGVSGIEICRRIKSDPELRATKVIVLTARADDAARFEALTSGADDYLTKPFSTIELRTRVSNLLNVAKFERMQLEELRNLNRQTVEALATGILLVGSSGKVLLTNSALLKLCGCGTQPPEKLSDMACHEFTAAVSDAIANGRATANQNLDVTVHGAVSHTLLSLHPVRSAAAETIFLVVLHDITEYTELEARSKKDEGLARVGEAISAINHELRNLAQPIFSQIKRLSQIKIDDPAYHESVGVLANRMEALNRLLNNLRDLSRPIELRLRKLNLAELSESVCRDLSESTQTHRVQILRKVDDAGAECVADGQWLRQAVFNVVRNAVEATAHVPEPRVTVSIERTGTETVLAIHDNGCGIAPDQQRRLFVPFFSTKGEAGTGLGLSISRKIVLLHGGRIDAESKSGVGTTFRIVLPESPNLASSVA